MRYFDLQTRITPELEEKEKIIKALMEEPIAINKEETSDAILIYSAIDKDDDCCLYQVNLMTGEDISSKPGEDEGSVTRKGKRFIELYGDESTIGKFWGIYAYESKLYDALIFAYCNLVKDKDETYHWEEIPGQRTVVSVKFNLIDQEIPFTSPYGEKLVDICGQTFQGKNCISGLKKTVLSYFGGALLLYKKNTPGRNMFLYGPFNSMQAISGLINNEIAKNSNIQKRCSVSNYIMRTGNFPDVGPLKDSVKEKMIRFIKEKIVREEYTHDLLYDTNIISFSPTKQIEAISYIQRVGDTYVERTFLPVLFLGPSVEETEVELVEIQQVEVSEYSYEKRICNVLVIPICCDEFAEDPRYSWIAKYTIKRFTDDIEESFKTHKKFTHVWNDFITNTGANIYKLPCTVMKFAKSDICEKIFKSPHMNNKAAYEMIKAGDIVSINGMICVLFGDVEAGERSLNKILQIPSGMLEKTMDLFEMNEADQHPMHLVNINTCKNIFSWSKEFREYFMRMNTEDITYLLTSICGLDSIRILLTKTLLRLYGHKNWKEYLKHMKDTQLNINMYNSYIAKLVDVADYGRDIKKGFDWKVSGESLENSYKAAFMLSEELGNQDLMNFAKAAFLKKEKEWKALEYEDTNYMVSAPREPFDIVFEGMELRHCAKEFIKPVANGATTLMFIRKKEAPQKPYFTLEIRGGTIRQCHGFDNRDVSSEDDSLYEFIKKYCRKKNIKLYDMNNKLGPV